MKRYLVPLAVIMLITSGHIGSPDVWIEGNAGPYPVVVNVQVPGVVPGIANVYVRATGDGVREVRASGNTFDATGGAPPPELATPVKGMPNTFHVPLWMMTPGSSSVTVFVSGTRGDGKLLVPVVIEAHQRLMLNKPLGITLGVIGIILFLGAVSVVGAAARESGLSSGLTPDGQRRKKGRLAMGGAVIVIVALLSGGWTWWNYEDEKFVTTLFKPMTSRSEIRLDGTIPVLDIIITDSAWKRRNSPRQRFSRRGNALLAPLVPDHGKLMHIFVIREPDMAALAHLHPATTDTVTFTTMLPPLPAGTYRVLADVVRESGYAETLSSTVTITDEAANAVHPTARPDPDDAWFIGAGASGDTTQLAPNVLLRWDRNNMTLTENIPAPLEFSVVDTSGNPVPLELYMGMYAHAMVMRDDGSVFVHLHPTGTVSMAAQETFVVRQATDTLRGMVAQRMQARMSDEHSGHVMPNGEMMMTSHISGPVNSTGQVRFPYAFPQPGNYRIWVQVKVDGRILTGSYTTTVLAKSR